MSDVKFSQFQEGNQLEAGDIIVGLRDGVNTKFSSPNQIGGPFLRIDQDLSDVQSTQESFSNLGFGSGQVLILSDSDFSGGVYNLSNPCPNFISILCNNPGNSIYLPPATGLGSFSLSEGPYIQIPPNFETVDVFDYSGVNLLTMSSPSLINYALSNKSTINGSWIINFKVSLVNGKSGIVETVVQSWNGSTSPVDITAGSGIDITDGVISLTGSGPSAAWSTEWTNDNNFSESFTDTTTFKGIRIDDLNAFSSNFTVALDGSSYIYFQYTGLETAEFRIGLTNRIRTVNNVNPNTYNYSLGIDSGSGIVPIYSGNALMPFVTQGNSDIDSVNVSYNISLLLDPGDKLYPIIQNRGDGNPTNNEYVVRNLLVDIQKIGDVGGVDSGVVSLNGLDGVLNLTSDGSIDIDPSGTSITLSAGTFTEVSGTSQSMVANGKYFCTNVANTTLSLPTSNCAAGSPIEVAGGNHQIIISQASGQKIYHGNGSTTTGVSGNLTSDPLNPYSCVKLVCINDNLTFQVVYSQGNFSLN